MFCCSTCCNSQHNRRSSSSPQQQHVKNNPLLVHSDSDQNAVLKTKTNLLPAATTSIIQKQLVITSNTKTTSTTAAATTITPATTTSVSKDFRLDTLLLFTKTTHIWRGTWIGKSTCDVNPNDSIIIKRTKQRHLAKQEVRFLRKLMALNPHASSSSSQQSNFFIRLICYHKFLPDTDLVGYSELVLQDGGEDLFNHFPSYVPCLLPSSTAKDAFTRRVKHLSFVMSKLVMCVIKLHALGYVHNDIKPENVVIKMKGTTTAISTPTTDVDVDDLLSLDMEVKLIDFALSTVAATINDAQNPHAMDGHETGTIIFRHPHLFWKRKLSLYHNDLWAIGQTALQLYTNKCLYDVHKVTTRQVNAVSDLFLNNSHWHLKLPFADRTVCDHEAFPMFRKFVSRMCCARKTPECANMMLLQEPFLCYWRVKH